jgi:hypothetical protein
VRVKGLAKIIELTELVAGFSGPLNGPEGRNRAGFSMIVAVLGKAQFSVRSKWLEAALDKRFRRKGSSDGLTNLSCRTCLPAALKIQLCGVLQASLTTWRNPQPVPLEVGSRRIVQMRPRRKSEPHLEEELSPSQEKGGAKRAKFI